MENLMTRYYGGYILKELCGIGRDGEIDDIDGCSDYCKDRSENDNCAGCAIQECFNRLGEYENTGLTPEKIVALDEEYTKLAKELMEYRKIGTVEECKKSANMQKQVTEIVNRQLIAGKNNYKETNSCFYEITKVIQDNY